MKWTIATGIAAAALALAANGVTAADDLAIPQVRLPLLAPAPAINGTVKDDEWAGAARMEGIGWGPLLSPHRASFWVGCDGKELFFAMVSDTAPGGRLLARVNPAPENGDARTWMDDSFEIVIDPLRSDTTDRRRLYHAILNAKNAIHDTAYAVSGGGQAWRGNWRLASKIVGDNWHFEAALPLQDMGVTADDLKKPFGLRICRNWQQSPPPHQTQWSPVAGPFLSPETLPVVTWDPAAPVVQVLQLQDAGKTDVHFRVSVRNPQAQPLELQTFLQALPASSAPREERSAFTLAPNETKIVELTASTANEDVTGRIRVEAKGGATVYYLREFKWRPAPPEKLWTLDDDAAKKVEVQFAYYPSFDRVRVRVDVTNLAEKAAVTGAQLAILKKGGETVASTALPPFANFAATSDWQIPALAVGEYELAVTLQGVKLDPVKVPFVRYTFPWEKNRLGKSDVVIPPFTPIRVQGYAVDTVLRTHALSPLGLWEQVTSLGQPLLKGPMRLELQAGGNAVPVSSDGMRFMEKKDTRVATASPWMAGKFGGTTGGEWDYDGLMWWTLEIKPAAEPVERLTLVIPLDNALMPLFHACTDGVRFNYAGKAPAGDGDVWDGRKAARNSLIGNYVPYIWLGAEERGLCVFGENDAGWVTAPDVPCQQLVRRGDTLELRLNLIAKSAVIDQPRRIRIGFQATPVKPMPANWRRWNMGADRPDNWNLSFSGSCWTWGALTPCLDIYPRDEDFSLWDEYKKARETGQVNQEFIRQWIEGFQPKNEEERKLIANNTNYGFHLAKGKPRNILVYTNARGVRFDTKEGQTFLNEWHRDLYPGRTWGKGGGVAYDLNPGESFRDYAMWYYKKMYETFVDAIYWDDIFPQSVFHPADTAAYERPDGQIQPAAGLADMRELIRRTAVLAHELGKTNANMPHITNTNLVPVLAFAGSHYTWEDRAGDADFQDRFSRDYLRAESIGLQCGNVPFGMLLMHGVTDKDKKAWIERTATGVVLTHEVRLAGGPWGHPVYCAAVDKLWAFGYGLPETTVSRYWDPDHPVSVTGTDATTLVCRKPGSAIVVVSDWANGGRVTLNLNLAALGLSGTLQATDLESKQPLEATADGKIAFDLTKHDFKLVLVEGNATK